MIRPTESDQPRIGDEEGGSGTVVTSRHGAKSTFKASGSQAVRFGYVRINDVLVPTTGSKAFTKPGICEHASFTVTTTVSFDERSSQAYFGGSGSGVLLLKMLRPTLSKGRSSDVSKSWIATAARTAKTTFARENWLFWLFWLAVARRALRVATIAAMA